MMLLRRAVVVYVMWYLLYVSHVYSKLCIFGDGEDCQFHCHCQGDASVTCDPYTGQCPNGCKKGHPLGYGDWQSDGCLLGNVAYQKPTLSNSVINRTSKNYNKPQLWYNTNQTVDGSMKLRVFDGSCTVVYTSNKTTLPWLMVDLQDQYFIPKVVLINTDNSIDSSYLETFHIKVGNTSNIEEQAICKRFYRKVRSAGKETITCDKPLIGRYITITKYSERNKVGRLPLCEFVVLGSKPIPVEWEKCYDKSAYNMFCQKCMSSIPPDCMNKCPPNSYGMYCQGICGNCNNSEPCDKITGKCDSCELGWQPPKCDIPCPNNTYGVDCMYRCGHCADNQQCNIETGQCPKTCQQWYAAEDLLCKTYIPPIHIKSPPEILFVTNTWAILVIPNDIPLILRNYYQFKLLYLHEKNPLSKYQEYTDFDIHFDNTTGIIKIEIHHLTRHTQYWFKVQIFRRHDDISQPGKQSPTVNFMTLDRSDEIQNRKQDKIVQPGDPSRPPLQFPHQESNIVIVLGIILAVVLLAVAVAVGFFLYKRSINNTAQTNTNFKQENMNNNGTVAYSSDYDVAVDSGDCDFKDTLAIIDRDI